jgi:hypothetical protein
LQQQQQSQVQQPQLQQQQQPFQLQGQIFLQQQKIVGLPSRVASFAAPSESLFQLQQGMQPVSGSLKSVQQSQQQSQQQQQLRQQLLLQQQQVIQEATQQLQVQFLFCVFWLFVTTTISRFLVSGSLLMVFT